MHALSVIYVLRAVEGIAEFKFVQHTVRDVEVLIVPGPNWAEAARAQVTEGLLARLGGDVRVTLRLVESIAAEPSGKYRYVVSHVCAQPDLALAAAVA
jgi:phenylacetate-CoA ligase